MVPPLSGSKQLKMRYKPANDGPVGRAGEDPSDPCKGELCYGLMRLERRCNQSVLFVSGVGERVSTV